MTAFNVIFTGMVVFFGLELYLQRTPYKDGIFAKICLVVSIAIAIIVLVIVVPLILDFIFLI